MKSYYQSQLGFTLEQIRSAHSHYRGMSYAQVEVELFKEDTGREPTFMDYLKWWWNGREERSLDRVHAEQQAVAPRWL